MNSSVPDRSQKIRRAANGRLRYTDEERALILGRLVPDAQLARRLGKSAQRIKYYRYELRRRAGLSGGSPLHALDAALTQLIGAGLSYQAVAARLTELGPGVITKCQVAGYLRRKRVRLARDLAGARPALRKRRRVPTLNFSMLGGRTAAHVGYPTRPVL